MVKLVSHVPPVVVGDRGRAELVPAIEGGDSCDVLKRRLTLTELALLQAQIAGLLCDQVQAELLRQARPRRPPHCS